MDVIENHRLEPSLSATVDKIEYEVYDEFLSTELLNQNNIQQEQEFTDSDIQENSN
jgi:hypothetical protein